MMNQRVKLQKKAMRLKLNKSFQKDLSQEHKCIISGKELDSALLIHVVLDPNDIIFPDIMGKLSWSGAWIEARRDIIAEAINSGELEAILEGNLPDFDLLSKIDALMLKRCQDSLAMGRRAGIVIGGGGKLRAYKTQVIGLIIANDASKREARALKQEIDHVWTAEILNSEELGQIFGRQSLAFAALLNKGHNSSNLGINLRAELSRLEQYRASA